MTPRGVTSGDTGPVVTRQPDSPIWDPPNADPFQSSPLTAPDPVPTALLHPPPTTADSHNKVVVDSVVRRLVELTSSIPAVFDVPTVGRTPAVALASHCPDLFLLSATADLRHNLVAEIAATAARSGQRVLVLANHPEAVFTSLAHHGEVVVGRAVAPDEDVTGRACVAHTAHARGQRLREQRRDELVARVTELQARIDTAEQREKRQAEADMLSADLRRLNELVVTTVEQSEAFKRLIEARDAGCAAAAAHAARRAELEQELTTLRQSATQPVGFFKKLFGGAGKPEPNKLEAIETRLRELTDGAPPDPNGLFAAAREQLIATETTTHRTELESRLAAVRVDLDRVPPTEPLDELCRAFDDATRDLARLDAAPHTQSAAELSAVRVVISPPAAIGHDPFLTELHPEVEPRFDRIVWADAEELTDDTFPAVARLGAAWVLVGTPDPIHPPGYRNGRPRAAFFSKWWERLHTAIWTQENDRLLARLLAVEHRGELHCEPLHGRPEVEVRWMDRGATPALAEVLFPAGMPASEAKQLLAHEADEVRCGGYGPSEWNETSEMICCRWPAVDAATGVRENVDLGNGVREECVAGVTAAVTFDASTWTRDSATRWLSERVRPPMRTAVL